MSLGLRLSVPILWVLILSSISATASSPSSSVSQLWLADPTIDIPFKNPEVAKDLSEHTANQSTSKMVSCDDVAVIQNICW